MKKCLATLALFLATYAFFQSTAMRVPSAEANGYESFDVSNILDIDKDDNSSGQSTDLFENIIESAREKNVSVVAAILLRAINILSLLVGTFTFVIILVGGFIMITAGGDEGKIDKGKNILNQAILGSILAFLAYFITAFVQSFFY